MTLPSRPSDVPSPFVPMMLPVPRTMSTPRGVAQGRRTADVGADEVARHAVVASLADLDPVSVVSGDDVALEGVGHPVAVGADDVARCAPADDHAVDVGHGLGAGAVRADEVPGDAIAGRAGPGDLHPVALVFPEMRLPSAASLTPSPSVPMKLPVLPPWMSTPLRFRPARHGAAGVDADEVALDAVVRPADDLNAGRQRGRVEADDVQPADQAAADAGEGQAGRAELVAFPSNWISGAPKPEPG